MTPRFPEQLETERLILRPPALADAERLLAAVTASYPELHQWMEWAKAPYGLDEAQAFCAAAARQAQEERSYPVLLTRKPSGRIVGASGFESVDWSVPKFGIGYWVRTDCVGLGYASEATRALTRLAFETLDAKRVQITMDDRNTRSWAVAERLGLEWEATLKAHARDNAGELRTTRIYAMFDAGQLR